LAWLSPLRCLACPTRSLKVLVSFSDDTGFLEYVYNTL
jgi:hypothetical protein